jgi:hypothetical protein
VPLAKYDKWFGGKGGAEKAMAAMREEYGDRAESVFYATMNKRKNRKRKTALTGRGSQD